MPGRSGAFSSIRAISSQVRNSRTMTGTKRRRRRTSRSMRARSVSVSGTILEKVSSVATTSAVCSATSRARQFRRLPAIARRRQEPRRQAVLLRERRVALAFLDLQAIEAVGQEAEQPDLPGAEQQG